MAVFVTVAVTVFVCGVDTSPSTNSVNVHCTNAPAAIVPLVAQSPFPFRFPKTLSFSTVRVTSTLDVLVTFTV